MAKKLEISNFFFCTSFDYVHQPNVHSYWDMIAIYGETRHPMLPVDDDISLLTSYPTHFSVIWTILTLTLMTISGYGMHVLSFERQPIFISHVSVYGCLYFFYYTSIVAIYYMCRQLFEIPLLH